MKPVFSALTIIGAASSKRPRDSSMLEAEGVELAPRQAAAHAEAQPALAQHVEHGGVLGDAQRIVPGQDDGGGADVDVRAHAPSGSVISWMLSGTNE